VILGIQEYWVVCGHVGIINRNCLMMKDKEEAEEI